MLTIMITVLILRLILVLALAIRFVINESPRHLPFVIYNSCHISIAKPFW